MSDGIRVLKTIGAERKRAKVLATRSQDVVTEAEITLIETDRASA